MDIDLAADLVGYVIFDQSRVYHVLRPGHCYGYTLCGIEFLWHPDLRGNVDIVSEIPEDRRLCARCAKRREATHQAAAEYAECVQKIESGHYQPEELLRLQDQRGQLHARLMDALDRAGIEYADRFEATEIARAVVAYADWKKDSGRGMPYEEFRAKLVAEGLL